MSTEVPKRIHLKGSGRHEEAVASGTITPGMLLVQDANGKVKAHATAGGTAERNYALEDALQGKIISDNYSSGDVVGYVSAQPGDNIYALLAAGEAVTRDEFLTSNGDGTLKVASGSDVITAVPLEDLDLSDSNESAAARLKIRVI